MLSEEIHKIPLVRLILPFILGIILQIKFAIELDFIFFVLAIAVLGFIAVLNSLKIISVKFYFPSVFGITLHIVLFILGIVISSNFKPNNDIPDVSDEHVIAEIIEIPVEKEKSVKAIVDVIYTQQNNSWKQTKGKVIIYLQKDFESKSLNVGDRLLFESKFSHIENSNNPNEFNYKQYLAFHLISKQIYLKSHNWKLLDSKNENSLTVLSQNIRKDILKLYSDNGITDKEYGVLAALTLGYKDKLDKEVKLWYSSSGAMHILAVSGLHIGIIFIILNSLFFFLNKCKTCEIAKTIIIILLLWIYAFITGLSPSVMRATIMFSFVATGLIFKRTISIYNTLAASAFLLLLINPLIIMEVGFQLSYLAVLSIVFFQPKILSLLHFDNIILSKIWVLISVSLAAQIGTFPLGLYYFHQFPNYFLLTNIVVIPFTGIIIYSTLFFIISAKLSFFPDFISQIIIYIVKTLNYIVKFIEGLPYSISSDIYISLSQTVLIYAIIITIAVFTVNKLAKTFYVFLGFILLLLISLNISKFSNLNQQKMYVYNIKGVSAYNFIDGENNILISNYNKKMDYQKLMYFVKSNWLKLGANNEKIIPLDSLLSQNQIFIKNNIINYHNTSFVIILDDYYANIKTNKKLNVDYIILAQNANINIKQLSNIFNFNEIIIDSSNSEFKSSTWQEECLESKIKVFSVAENGAFEIIFNGV